MKRYAALGLCALFLAAGPSVQAQGSYHAGQAGQKQLHPGADAARGARSAKSTTDEPEQKTARHQDEKPEARQPDRAGEVQATPGFGDWRDRISPWLTISVGVATLFQAAFAVFAYFGWREARRSADIAESNFALSRETTMTQLRAYVGVAGKVQIKFVSLLPQEIHLRFLNSGATPARDLTFFALWGFAAPDAVPTLPEGRGRGSKVDVGPGVEFTPSLWAMPPGYFPDHVIDAWRRGELWLHAFGSVTYTDAFDVRRETCFDFLVTRPIAGHMVRYDQGNHST